MCVMVSIYKKKMYIIIQYLIYFHPIFVYDFSSSGHKYAIFIGHIATKCEVLQQIMHFQLMII